MTTAALVRWLFLGTQLGIMFALIAGVIVMLKMNQKLDRDHNDRDLLRNFLLEQSNRALAAAQSVSPATMHDRRQP